VKWPVGRQENTIVYCLPVLPIKNGIRRLAKLQL
jgi:hypothetical protein